MKKILLFLIGMLTFNSCTRPQNELNQYFFDINQEVSIAVDEHQPERIKAIYDRELKKYKEFKTNQYLISSKFVELSLYQNNYNKKKQLLLYKLIQINNGQYNYISIVCNYHLSIQYENTSPELSLEFLNKAICLDEKSKKKYFLPHLYHQKGRYYYKSKDYNKALIYFNKSLKALDKNNILFIASMHNNFALCYYKLGKTNLAIKETNRAIQLLKEKKNKVAEDDLFLYYILGNLGDYYMELKNYDKAKELYNAEFNFDKSGNFLNEIMGPSKRLFNLLTLTNDHQGLKELIVYLIKKEEELVTIQDKIQANKFIQIYYANHNDFQNLKIFSEKGIKLNDQYKAQVEKSHMETSDLLNQYIIKNVNQKYDYEKKRSFLLKLVFFLSIILSATIIIYIITHNKKERELMENQKIILEDNKKLLEQDLEIQDQKLKNLYLRLNLKMETEKAFLESLKNLKKLRIQEPEQILKDLLLKVTNLLDIDKRDYDLLTESSLQNEHFIKKLSLQFSRLTKYELKLCVYFRLELSSKEIASFENTTPNTIRVYKTKIKTKIGLDKNSSLDQFLKSV